MQQLDAMEKTKLGGLMAGIGAQGAELMDSQAALEA